jgi:hypothetical protein
MLNPFGIEIYNLITKGGEIRKELFEDFSGTLFSKDTFPAVPKPEQAEFFLQLKMGMDFGRVQLNGGHLAWLLLLLWKVIHHQQ